MIRDRRLDGATPRTGLGRHLVVFGPGSHNAILQGLPDRCSPSQDRKWLISHDASRPGSPRRSGRSAPYALGASCHARRRRGETASPALPSRATCLYVTGETGSGKRSRPGCCIRSHRAGLAFVAINCAASPDAAGERDLRTRKRGLHGRDVFPCGLFRARARRHALPRRDRRHASACKRVLRLIEDGSFLRVSGRRLSPSGRDMAATHRDLAEQERHCWLPGRPLLSSPYCHESRRFVIDPRTSAAVGLVSGQTLR
jgi:hypothetical protein